MKLPQFSLRELFLLVLVCAFYLGWWKDWSRLGGIIDQQSKYWHNERNEYLWAHWKETESLKEEIESLKAELAAERSKTP